MNQQELVGVFDCALGSIARRSYVNDKDSNQTASMRRLIRVFLRCSYNAVEQLGVLEYMGSTEIGISIRSKIFC